MPPFAPPFMIPPISPHTHTLILLHPHNATSQSFALSLLSAISSSGKPLQTLFPGTKFVFPTANMQCVTAIEGGPRMPQWFDNYSTMDPSKREALQFKGLREGARHVHDIVDAETMVPLEHVFLGGFGQGSAMALYALLTYRSESRKGRLGGFVGMSGWLPLLKSLDGIVSICSDENLAVDRDSDFDTNAEVSTLLRNQIGLPPVAVPPPEYGKIPIYLAHGEADDEVPVNLARQATDSLSKLGLSVTLKTYEGLNHTWRNGDEIDDIATFLSTKSVT